MQSAASAAITAYEPFRYDHSCRALDKQQFQLKLDGAKSTLDNASQRLMEMQARVYSLSAPCASVELLHDQWKAEAGSLKALLVGCQSDLNELYEYLPFLEPAYALVVLPEVDWLRERLPRITTQIQELYDLVENTEYTSAHRLSKMAVKDCEDFSKNPKAQDLAKRCERLFITTIRAIREQVNRISSLRAPHIQRQILQLHTDTLELFKQRMGQLLPPTSELLGEINQAYSDKKAELQKPSFTAPVMNDELQSYLATFANENLTGPLNFKQIRSSFTGWFTVNIVHSNIRTSVQKMKHVAKGVQKLEADVTKALKNFVQAVENNTTKLPLYKTVLLQLRYSLQEARRQLLEQSKSGEVHAGLYYADQLEKALSELRKKLDFLENLSRTDPTNAAESRQKLLTYLDAFTSSTNILYLEMHALFDVAYFTRCMRPLSAHAPEEIRRFYRDITTTTERLVAKISPLTLAKGLKIDDIFTMIVQQKPVNEFQPEENERTTWLQLPENLKAVLIRECTKALFFHQNESLGNAKLDCILFFLQHLPRYKKLYTDTLRQDPAFQKALICYQERIYRLSLPDFFSCIAHAFTLAEDALSHPHERYLTIFTYSRACELVERSQSLFETQQDSLTNEMRLACLQTRELAKAKLEQVRKQFDFNFSPFPTGWIENINRLQQYENTSQDYLSILFSALTIALYGQGEQRQQIQARLHAYFSAVSSRSNIQMPRTLQLRYLMANCIFRLESRNFVLNTCESQIIQKMLVEYVRDPNLYDALQKAEGADIMEQRLCQHKDLEEVQRAIKDVRGTSGFESWCRGMSYVENFKKTSEQRYRTWLQELVQSESNPLAPAYKTPLTLCLDAMTKTGVS